MDGRRRPPSYHRQAPGSFVPGVPVPGARPTSASRRKSGESQSGAWAKDRRPFDTPGLTRQASAPSLVPNASPNMSFDSFTRSSPQGNYDSFTRSPGLRRSSSATAVGRGGVPGLRSSSMTRGSGFSSAPRRRPYESPPSYATPERDYLGGSRGNPGGSLQHRADALQLESRLTERLREHSLSGTEGASRRPATGDPRRPLGGGRGNSSFWQEDSFAQSFQNSQSRFASPFDHRGSPPYNPASRVAQDWRGMPNSTPQMEDRFSRSRRSPQDSYTNGSGMTPPHGGAPHLRVDDPSMPESRLKIYSDLFEEVIERDRVFGSLLRKIKTAYDMLLLRSPAVPPLPMDNPSPDMAREVMGAWPQDLSSSSGPGRMPGGPHSNEPTTRAEGGLQAWEMQRENRVLKDLVERLHLELEEAVRREHRWKQKVTKLKARVEVADEDAMRRQALQQSSYNQGSDQKVVLPEDPHETAAMRAASNGAPRFAAMQREPHIGDMDAQEGLLNQGGLLSMSSISPQTSLPPFPDSSLGVSGAESARSTDSGMLPQRPTRRHVTKPESVPKLDFSRLKNALEEEDEEEDEEGEDLADGGLEEEGLEYADAADEDDRRHLGLDPDDMIMAEGGRQAMHANLESDGYSDRASA
mmetsp:Transcript_117435/g.216217  ORF Transcript_117435/g.216217 Transcript_117435/m.216217 type:complete len:639 (-) Transcript_117435:109-2025(-)